MTDADKAYKAAQRLIAMAKEKGATRLNFDTAETHALPRMPPEIANLSALRLLDMSDTRITDLQPLTALTGLTTLYLHKTPITDLQPLTALTGLTRLSLTNTRIRDLRPLRNLRGLVENPGQGGLRFTDTPATRTDPRIAEIAEIDVPATRARELFGYLETWVPPAR